eukprot:TRINITY_DN28202_c0_g1_i3.p1 TRINITY_DN28202_c0_g1~~TRINITY_DN28202_c0_g1_i3.p1  ORF type:complete len:387 (+),score=78.92 TRINITY_DN28202_c0_g1_i3:195-1355(+)
MDLDENSAAAVCFTSGTTGKPKGVVYSHRALYIHTLMMVAPDVVNLSGVDVVLPVVPYFHANGWGLPYAILMLGCRTVHNSSYTDPSSILGLCCDHKVTLCAAVPAIWQTARQALQSQPEKYNGNFKVKQIICGGTAPPFEMMKWYWETYRTAFLQAWGMTETTPLGTVSRQVCKFEHTQWTPEAQLSNVAKTGLPVPTVEMMIVDSEDMSKVLPNDGKSQGELLIRGPHITGRYYEVGAEASFPGGWLATGDIATLDQAGYMVICDRSKDVIKSGGEWISSKDLEGHISGLKGVGQVAVVAVAHPRWDERPVCVVVPVPGSSPPSLAEVHAHCLKDGAFAKYELPDDVLVWRELPMTGTGKISKKSIREQLKSAGYQLPGLQSKL